MNRAKTSAMIMAIVAITGCATPVETTYTPIVDMKGVDYSAFNKDLDECRQYATQTWNAQQGAVGGAIAGALLGAAIGAVFGLRGQSLAQVSGASAITGGAAGAGTQYRNQTDIVKNCMVGRGYRVLG